MKEIRAIDHEEMEAEEIESGSESGTEREQKRKEAYETLQGIKEEITILKEDKDLNLELKLEIEKTKLKCSNLLTKLNEQSLNCFVPFDNGAGICRSAGKAEHGYLCGKHKGKDGERGSEMIEIIHYVAECVQEIHQEAKEKTLSELLKDQSTKEACRD